MKVTENMKSVKINTLLKDDGYFVVIDYDKQSNFYICIGCDDFVLAMLNKYGITIFEEFEETFDDDMFILKMEDLIGAEIIKEF